MSKIKFPELPFLTREMLSFGRVSKIELKFYLSSRTTFVGRISFLTKDGFTEQQLTAGSSGSVNTVTLALSDIPIFASIRMSGDDVGTPIAWGAIKLLINGEEIATLASGMVSNTTGPTYPATQTEPSIPGHGFIGSTLIQNPAAGAELDYTTPAGETWRIMYGHITLVTDATVANRVPRLVCTDINGAITASINGTAITASETKFIHFGHYGGPSTFNYGNRHLLALPDNLWLNPASTIETVTDNLQAGDAYGACYFMVERFYAN